MKLNTVRKARDTADEQRVLNMLDAMRPEIVALLQELVRLPSENRPPRGDEGRVQAFVADKMGDLGLRVDVFEPSAVQDIAAHPGWLAGHEYDGRPDVVGVAPGIGTGPSLLLLAHADVEEAGPHHLWSHPPYAAEVAEGEVFGRGVGDDKAGICAALVALEALRRCELRPRGRVAVASVVDEERGGGNGTLACLLRGHTADAGLYLDGVGLQGDVATLGGGCFIVHTRQVGPPRAITDTLAHVARITRAFEDLAPIRCTQIRSHPGYERSRDAAEGVTIARVTAGDAVFKYARRAEIECWGVALPSEQTPSAMLAAVQRYLDDVLGVGDQEGFRQELQWAGRFLEATAIPRDSPIVSCLAAAFREATGHELPIGTAGMSDQPLMNRYGAYPTVGFGLSRPAGRGAYHAADEAVSIERELMPYVRTVALAVMRWCGYGPS